jgi:hypothetical protein
MKATLEFNLPEENSEHRTCVFAGELSSVIWDISQQIREWLSRSSTITIMPLSSVYL